jgi:HPt (histidine-containing phosphotransfer) domain-containing protein
MFPEDNVLKLYRTNVRPSMPAALEGVFDRTAALALVEGDAELLAEIAALFLDTHVEQLDAIREAMAGHDAQSLKNAAHTLKGAIGNFAAREAFEAAQRLETMARLGDLTRAEHAFTMLDAALSRLKDALTGVLQQAGRQAKLASAAGTPIDGL